MFMSTLTAPTPKQQARELIERLPDTATWDDVAQALAGELGDRARVAAAASLNGEAVLHGACAG
ncbi:MAG: hypothetical protein QOF32_1370 [Gammaproteobacteria bacterium]|nr:hypothetical protein [Gammaproteobacteria bacterium]